MSLREGGLQAPTRHPLDWQSADFYDEQKCLAELERVFDICHGCRRCVSLCDSFPVLFDLIDESPTLELDGVDKARFSDVVDQCYLCDLCYQTKCPYVPPHEWALDYPHLMLRAKAIRFKQEGSTLRDKVLTATTTVGALASIPVIDVTVNALNKVGVVRKGMEAVLGVHHKAKVPQYDSNHLRKRLKHHQPGAQDPQPADENRHLRCSQCEQLRPVYQHLLCRNRILLFEVVAETIGTGLKYSK